MIFDDSLNLKKKEKKENHLNLVEILSRDILSFCFGLVGLFLLVRSLLFG